MPTPDQEATEKELEAYKQMLLGLARGVCGKMGDGVGRRRSSTFASEDDKNYRIYWWKLDGGRLEINISPREVVGGLEAHTSRSVKIIKNGSNVEEVSVSYHKSRIYEWHTNYMDDIIVDIDEPEERLDISYSPVTHWDTSRAGDNPLVLIKSGVDILIGSENSDALRRAVSKSRK